MHEIPIVRFELEGMKMAFVTAFSKLQIEQDQMVKHALDKFCSPERIQYILDRQCAEAIEEAMKKEINHFFSYGAGQRIIKDAVNKRLDEKYQPSER